jgi:bifunctional non-homologous end joining protein LigD
VEAKVEYELQTPDGAWRVEVVKRGRTRWYRISHGDNVVDWLAQATMERTLREAGVDLADLVEVPHDVPAQAVDDGAHGVA